MSLELRFFQLRVGGAVLAALVCGLGLAAQEPRMQVPKVVPVPQLHPMAPAQEPVSPAAREVSDGRDGLTFHLPPGWNLTRKDGEASTFRLDARTAPSKSQVRMVASLAFNPYPQSTFSGALFYVSATPGLRAAACAAETTAKPYKGLEAATIDGKSFWRGKDEHGHICTEGRDVAYTAMRGKACLRFDLAINSFCGGDVSGAEDLTEGQLQALYTRLATILNSVRFKD